MCDRGEGCEEDGDKLVTGWDLADFLVFVLIIEHIFILAKILLE